MGNQKFLNDMEMGYYVKYIKPQWHLKSVNLFWEDIIDRSLSFAHESILTKPYSTVIQVMRCRIEVFTIFHLISLTDDDDGSVFIS